MATISAKVCTACGVYVSNQKRVKDAQGHYFCHPCWNKKVASRNTPQAAAPVHEPSLDDFSEVEASAAPVASRDDQATCSICHQRFPFGDMHNHEGQPVCTDCIMTVAMSAPDGGSATSDGMKECPHCAELIKAKAKKCRYCGESVLDEGTIPLANTSRRAPVAAQSSDTMPSLGAVQTSPDSVTLCQPLHAAFRSVVHAISNIGEVREQNLANGLVSGVVKNGINSIKVKASLTAFGSSTKVKVETSRGDVFGYARKCVTRRVVEMLCNLDNPQYRPKRDDSGPLDGISIGVGVDF